MGYKIKKYAGKPAYNLSKRSEPPRYIAVHYTGGKGSARNNVLYFRSGDRKASADFFIDDSSIWRFNPNVRKWYSWAVGDGHGAYGITNANSISIEVVNNGGAFTDKEIERLHWLVHLLMDKYGIPAERVVRHYDASRKHCPEHYVESKRWEKLHAAITK